jgi:tetratricopeptide (TPR) repeat protein
LNVIQEIRSDQDLDVEIVQFIQNTSYYKGLKVQLDTHRLQLEKTNDAARRKILNEKIKDLESEVTHYKLNILLTASTLVTVASTPSIREAQDHFFNDNVSEAIESLHPKTSIDAKLLKAYDKIRDNAHEFLIKAQLISINLDIKNPFDRFEKSIEFYEKGNISILRSGEKNLHYQVDYLYSFSVHLENHKKYEKALDKYKKAIKVAKPYAKKDAIYLSMIAEMYSSISRIYAAFNQYDKVELYLKKALRIDVKLSKSSSEPEASFGLETTLNNLGVLNQELSNFAEAKKYYKQAIELRSSHLDEVSISSDFPLAKYYGNIGIVELKEGNYTAAMESTSRALEIFSKGEKWFTDDISFGINTMITLGLLHIKQENYERAEYVLLKCEMVYEQLIEKNPMRHEIVYADIKHYLGVVYSDLNFLEKAFDYFKEALEIKQRLEVLEPNAYKLDIANSYADLAKTCYKSKSFNQSEQYYLSALEIYESLSTNQSNIIDEHIADIHNNLGALYNMQNLYLKAMEKLTESLAVTIKLSNKNPEAFDSDLMTVYRNLGLTSLKLEDWKTAEKHLLASYELSKKNAEKQPEYAAEDLSRSLADMATLYTEKNQFEEAEKYYLEAIFLMEKLSAENEHKFEPLLASFFSMIGVFYGDIYKLKQSEEYFTKSINLYHKIRSEENFHHEFELANVHSNFADVYKQNRKFELAKINFEKSLEIYEKLQSIDASDIFLFHIAAITHNLGQLHSEHHFYEPAMDYYTTSLQTLEHISEKTALHQTSLGELHISLANLYSDQKRYEEAEEHFEMSIEILESMESSETVLYRLSESYTGIAIVYAYTDRLNLSEQYSLSIIHIREELCEINTHKYLVDLAYSYQNAASIYEDRKEPKNASTMYEKAKEAYKTLTELNPEEFTDYLSFVEKKLAFLS